MNIDVKPDWWKSLFDDVYLMTDARSVCDEEITRREVDAVCTLLAMAKDDAILDLCGGQGRHSIELARRGYGHCTVLDYSGVLIEHGRSNALQKGLPVNFVQGDAVDTGLPDQAYDHVLILGNSLGYMPKAVDDLRIMQEVMRILKPGGSLLIDVTDGAAVLKKFNPNAWHEIDDRIVVCRQRQLEGDSIRAREVVICKEQGLVRDQTYAIRLLLPEVLETLVAEAGFVGFSMQRGFCAHDQEGDYGFMNHRLLVTAKRPA
jgi:D-alanine-D-alanine ligase